MILSAHSSDSEELQQMDVGHHIGVMHFVTNGQTNLLAERWGVQWCLEPHLVWDDWLWLLHADWLVEQGALVQGELGVGVQRWADLEGSWRRGTHAGRQHLGLAEGRGQGVAGRPGIALEVRQGEGARRAQVGWGGLWGHAVQGLLWGQQVGGLTCLLGTFWFRVIISLWMERQNLIKSSDVQSGISIMVTHQSWLIRPWSQQGPFSCFYFEGQFSY